MVAIRPLRAPVSGRALSTTSRSTVSTSRLALMHKTEALRLEMRSSSLPTLGCGPLRVVKGAPALDPAPR